MRLDRRYRKSVAEEGGMNTGRTWVWDGNRRQTGPIVGVRRLYACTLGRSQVVPHRPHQCLCPHPMPGDPSSSWTGDTSQQCASQQEMARLDRDGAHQGGNHLASTWERAGKRPGVQTSGPVVLFPRHPKENSSSQSSRLEPATACLEGRVSQNFRPLVANWLYWLR